MRFKGAEIMQAEGAESTPGWSVFRNLGGGSVCFVTAQGADSRNYIVNKGTGSPQYGTVRFVGVSLGALHALAVSRYW